MKIALCAALAFCAPLPLLAAGPDTAYQALRTIGTERGADTLKHVIEVEGRSGVPQPIVWRVVLDDPSARGGVREIDVSHGKVVGEHTPVRAYSGSAAGALIDFQKLNLDSSGAFTVAEKEAQKARVGFDSVDYILRTSDGPDATPVWEIHMMDATRHSLGTLSVGADSGLVVSTDLYGHKTASPYAGGSPPAVAPPPAPDYTGQDADHDNLYTTGTDVQPPPQADENDTEDTHGLRIGHRIKQAFMSAGESLKNFVTGQSSSDH